MPTEDVSPVVQQQAVNSDDAGGGLTDPPLVTPTGTNLFFLQMPTSAAPGTPLAPPVRVQVRDLAGAAVAGRRSRCRSAIRCSTPRFGHLVATGPTGIATFPALSISAPGEGYTLPATAAIAGGIATGVSVPFDISPGAVVVNTADSGPGSLRAAISPPTPRRASRRSRSILSAHVGAGDRVQTPLPDLSSSR